MKISITCDRSVFRALVYEALMKRIDVFRASAVILKRYCPWGLPANDIPDPVTLPEVPAGIHLPDGVTERTAEIHQTVHCDPLQVDQV